MWKTCTSHRLGLRSCVLLALFFLGNISWAQPPNDDPCTAEVLSLNLVCNPAAATTGTNVAATSSGVPDPTCGALAGGADVWYTFTMPANGYHVTLNVNGIGITEGAMTAYSGANCSSLTELSCAATAGIFESLTVEDGCNFEYAGAQIWVRLWELGNDAQGTFEICAEAHPPIQDPSLGTCPSNPPAADECCDAVLFSDDLDGYCGNTGNYMGEADITGFCANLDNNGWVGFVASEDSVVIDVAVSNCTFGNGLQMIIWETTDCGSFTPVSNCWNPNIETNGTLTANGLTPGNYYIIMVDGWAGDVCDYTLTIVEGVQTTMATNQNYEICSGNSVQIGVDVFGVGPYNFAWTPVATLDDPTTQYPNANPTTSTTYTVHVTGAIDTMINVDVNVRSGPPSSIMINGSNTVCENAAGEIYYGSAIESDSLAWSLGSGGTIVGAADADSVIIDWGSAIGPHTVTVEAFNICGSNSQTFNVNVVGAPSITATDPTPICAPNTFDLNTISVTNASPFGGPSTYYTNMADAHAATNALTNFTISTGGQYWIRMESAPNCYDVTSVNIVIEDPQIAITDPQPFCEPVTFDLMTVNIVENNGASALDVLSFHNSMAEAISNSNPLTNTDIGTSGTWYARYQTVNGCFDTAPVNITVYQRPDITFTTPLEICTGDSLELTTLTYTDANATNIVGVQFFPSLNFAQIGLPGLEMSNTNVGDAGPFFMRATTDNGCFIIEQIDLTVHPLPTASIAANGTACFGENLDLTFNLTGTGPFDVVYSDGSGNNNLSAISDGHIESVVVTADATFGVVSVVDLSNNCSNTGGSSVAVMVNAEANVTLSGDNDICAGSTTDLQFDVTGDGPFTIVYNDGMTNFTLSNITGPTHVETVSPTANTAYTLVSVSDNLNCSGNLNGTATINVGTQINIANFQETCNAGLTGYTISFDVNGGNPANYTVTGITGSFSGNTYTSDEITGGTPYSFSVSDGSACPSVDFNGTYDCNCTASPGLMDPTLVQACRGGGVTVADATNLVLEPGFVQEYVLHDNAGNSLGTVFGRNSTPSFNLVAGMSTGVIYYISSVVGPDNGIGGIDDTHICYQVSTGTPIIIYDLAAATISGDAISCAGAPVNLLIDIVGGEPPFDVVYSDGSNQFTLEDILDGHSWVVNPTTTSSYTIVSIVDNTTVLCVGSFDGSATVTIAEPPVADNIQFECDATNTQYRVTFEVTGGVPSSYTFSGDPGTYDMMTGIFTSDWYPHGNTYTFNLDDGNGCGPTVVTGDHVCDCTTNAGSMASELTEVCESGTAFFTVLDPPTLDADDVEGYILHNGVGNTPFTIFQSNSIPEFNYNPAMSFGTIYYVSRIVGNDDGSGSPVTEMALDPCLSISNGQPVIFYPEAVVGISGDLELCEGDEALVQVNINQAGQYNLVYNNGAGDFPFDNVTDGQIISLPMVQTGTITLVSIAGTVGPNCVGSIDPANSMINVVVHEFPVAGVANIVCDEPGATYTIAFDISQGDDMNYAVTGAGTLNGNIFTSDPIPSGTTYNFEVTDGTGCPPVIVSGTHTCLCTSAIEVNINEMTPVSCNGLADGALIAMPTLGAAPYSYTWSNGAIENQIGDLAPGMYSVTMEDANGCIRESSFEVIEPTLMTANFATTPTTCFGYTDGVVQVNGINGGTSTGAYEIEIGGLTATGNEAEFNLPAGIYDVSIFDDNGCEYQETIEVEGPEEFTVDLGPDQEISLGETVDLLAVTNGPLDSLAWLNIPDLTCGFCENQTVKPAGTTAYAIEVYNEAGCRAVDEVLITVDESRPIYVPNAFSPNSDGENDRFSIYGGASVERIVSVHIYSRWGALMYENFGQEVNNPLDGWNGRFKGKKMESGVYLYVVEVEYIDGETEVLTGDVTIIR